MRPQLPTKTVSAEPRPRPELRLNPDPDYPLCTALRSSKEWTPCPRNREPDSEFCYWHDPKTPLCIYTKRDGSPCGGKVSRGSDACASHGKREDAKAKVAGLHPTLRVKRLDLRRIREIAENNLVGGRGDEMYEIYKLTLRMESME